jgi:hypothetical protein
MSMLRDSMRERSPDHWLGRSFKALRLDDWPALAVALALTLPGCATVQPPTSSHLALLDLMRGNVQGGPVEVHAEETPPLLITTRAQEQGSMLALMFPTASVSGGLGAAGAATRRGRELEREGGIPDPTEEIARRSLERLQRNLGVTEGPSLFRLEVATQSRGVGSEGFYLQTRVDLVDARTDTSVAWALCRYQTPASRLPADLEAMLDDIAFVKQEQESAIADCVDYFGRNAVP